MFSDHMVRDIDAGRFPEDANMILCTHGLTLRLFLMRWFHWTVAEYERIANPSNSQPIILERRDSISIEASMHHQGVLRPRARVERRLERVLGRHVHDDFTRRVLEPRSATRTRRKSQSFTAASGAQTVGRTV